METTQAPALGWPRSDVQRIRAVPPLRWVPPGFALVTPLLPHMGLTGPWGTWVSLTHYASVLRPVLRLKDWELIALRATWNCGGFLEWNYHLVFQRLMEDSAYLIRLKQGPEAPGWTDKQAAILTAVDKLHTDLTVSEQTWARLAPYLNDSQRTELCVVTGMYELLSMVFSSIGHPSDLPQIERRATRGQGDPAWGPRRPRPDRPKAPVTADVPLAHADRHAWLPYDPAVYERLAEHHPRVHRLVDRMAPLVASRTKLPSEVRDLAILRTIWRCGPVTEWAIRSGLDPATAELARSGAAAARTSQQAAVLRAVDELDSTYFVSDRTWLELAESLDRAQLIELCLLVGHHRMFAMLMNSLGQPAASSSGG